MPAPSNALAAHITKLRAKEAAAPALALASSNNLLFWGTHADREYLPHLKGCVGSATVFLRLDKITTITAVTLYCKSKGVTRVVSTSIELLKKLLVWDKRKAPSLANYAGSYFTTPALKSEGLEAGSPKIEIIFIQPLKQLVTVPYGRFMATRLISKLTAPEKWYAPTPFTGFTVATPENEHDLFLQFQSADLICIDIETFKEGATIRCLSYTAFYTPTHTSISVVLPLDSDYNLAIMRRWNWELQAPKVFQNGKYDISYLARYSAPCYNYLYDTANLFHSWFSELPKDLGFLNSFFIRESVYWKDLAETNDLHEYYRYNALDTWGTGNAFLAMILEAPAYATANYLLEFPLTFPCHLAEMTGIARDMPRITESKAMLEELISTHTTSLNIMLDIPPGETFNTNSPKQMKALLKVLGCADLTSADEKALKKARFRHPFNARIINNILAVRKARKLLSTYLTPGKEFTRQDGTGHRILYALNPHGTDSSRLASREHHFWAGLNVQNIPRGPAVKRTLRADPGFLLCEVDLEQAESRDTAYISGDETLIENVEHSPDFHCANASAFFGVPFDQLYDIATGKKLNTKLRDIAKRVNHGANYNMGPGVLIETMGEEAILKAKQLLALPRFWSYMQVATHLLEQFHKTYPDISGKFYKGMVQEVLTTGKITSQAWHHSWNGSIMDDLPCVHNSYEEEAAGKSWTRYCFSDPSKSKSALNSYISHPPQSLNAQTLNKSFLTVFHDIAIHPKHKTNFKLLAQIHDSILFQYREGHEYLCEMVRERMEVPVTIKGYDNKIRTFVVPAGIKSGKHTEAGVAHYWSETE